MSIRESFIEKFGLDNAQAMEEAANFHRNGVHDNPGSDPFKWAICICIGSECFTRPEFREHHGFTADPEALKEWIRDYADLPSHDGDVDYIALFCGMYNGYFHETSSDAMVVMYSRDANPDERELP